MLLGQKVAMNGLSLHKVSQLHHFVEQLLQVLVGDLAFKRGHKGLCFLSGIRA